MRNLRKLIIFPDKSPKIDQYINICSPRSKSFTLEIKNPGRFLTKEEIKRFKKECPHAKLIMVNEKEDVLKINNDEFEEILDV
jgi:hypothetical protein